MEKETLPLRCAGVVVANGYLSFFQCHITIAQNKTLVGSGGRVAAFGFMRTIDDE